MTNALNGALAGAQSFLEGAEAIANGVLDNAVNGPGGFRSVMDAIVGPAIASFESNVAGINTAFDGFVAGQTAGYDGLEQGAWNNYLTATDSSPTGLQWIYNAAIASDATIRDTILNLYPNVNYSPDILQGTTTYDSLISGANATLSNDLTTATNTFDSSVQSHQGTFDNAVYGPGGAVSVYDGLMVPVNSAFDSAMDVADTNYNGAIATAQGSYDNTVNGPGGLVDSFESSVAGFQTAYNGAVQVAQGIYDGLVSAAETIYNGAITGAEVAYQGWLSGNSFVPAMQSRVTTLDAQLTLLGSNFSAALTGLRTTAAGLIATANSTFESAANTPGTGFAYQLQNAVTAANNNATFNVNQDWTTYQGQYNSFMMTNMMAMMTAMMNNLPLPPINMGPILIDTQNYALEVASEEISYSDSVGSAYVAYVGSERAADTTRDLSIIDAINTYYVKAINLADSYQALAIADIKSCLDDLTNLQAAFEIADVGMQVVRGNSINNATQALAIAEDAAIEGFAIAESNAALPLAQGVAGSLEVLRNGEMGARILLGQAAATAAEQWENARASAVQTWMNGAASASNQYTILVTNAAEALQNNVLGAATQLTNDTCTAMQTWVGTVASGVASQWATYMGSGSDVTAVANAWSSFSLSAANDWASFTNAEAALFQTYGQQEANAHKVGDQAISTQNVIRVGSVASQIVSGVSTVAGAVKGFEQSAWGAMAPWMASVAGAERTANNLAAGAVNGFELGLAPQVRSSWDAFANAFHGFFGGVLSDYQPYAQNVISQEQTAGLASNGQANTLLTTSRTVGTQYLQDKRASWKTYADGVAGAEDKLVVASAKSTKAHVVLGAVNHYYDLAALSPSAFESQVGQQRPFLPAAAMALVGGTNDETILISAGNALPSSSIDSQLFMRQLQESVDPIHHGMSMPGPLLMPLQRNDLMEHLSRAGLGNMLPGPSYDLNVVYSPGLQAEIEAEIAARPQQPSLGVSLIPFVGNYQNMIYQWQTAHDPFAATFYAGMIVGDVFLVKTVAQGLGKVGFRGIQRGAQALWLDEAGSIVIPNLGRGAEAAAAAKAGQAIDAAATTAASKLGIDLSEMVVKEGVARLEIIAADYTAPELLREVARAGHAAGANTVIINTGLVLNQRLAAQYLKMAARDGGRFVGAQNAVIRLLEITDLGRVPIFEIVFTLP